MCSSCVEAGDTPIMLKRETRGDNLVSPYTRFFPTHKELAFPRFRRSAAPSGRSGLGAGQKIGRANGRFPSFRPLVRTAFTIPTKPSCHTSLRFLTRAPSIRSLSLHHLTPSTPCYSAPVRAPAFRERQTGAPWPGLKSSTWPPSVSRSTDRVTQNNGIDPKPFWRLRAIPGAAPHQAAAGAPLAGRPGVGNYLPRIGLGSWCALQSRKMGTATNSLAVMPSKQRTQPEANWLAVPDFSPIPHPFHGRKMSKFLPQSATNCHISSPGRYRKISI